MAPLCGFGREVLLAPKYGRSSGLTPHKRPLAQHSKLCVRLFEPRPSSRTCSSIRPNLDGTSSAKLDHETQFPDCTPLVGSWFIRVEPKCCINSGIVSPMSTLGIEYKDSHSRAGPFLSALLLAGLGWYFSTHVWTGYCPCHSRMRRALLCLGSRVQERHVFWYAACMVTGGLSPLAQGAKIMTYVMSKPCPVCKQQLTKQRPTDTGLAPKNETNG